MKRFPFSESAARTAYEVCIDMGTKNAVLIGHMKCLENVAVQFADFMGDDHPQVKRLRGYAKGFDRAVAKRRGLVLRET